MIKNIVRGHVVEVIVLKKINPSQIFTNFFDDYKGRISIFDLDWSIPLALKKFSEIQENEKIQCVVLNIDHKNKIVELAVKYIIENVSKEIGWDRIIVGNEYHAKVIEPLNNYVLLKISDAFYGIIARQAVNKVKEEYIRVKVLKKDSYNNLLYVVSAEEDIIFTDDIEEIESVKFNFIPEDYKSYQAFKKSTIGGTATDDEIKEVRNGFKLDKKIFSKNFSTGKTIYLQFGINNNTYKEDFINKALPFFASDITDENQKQKKTLEALSLQKYWFKTNSFLKQNDEIKQFTFFNDLVSMSGDIIYEEENDNVRFEIRKLSIQNTDVKSVNNKKQLAARNSFLFSDDIKVLGPYDAVPIGYSQIDIANLAIQKTKCFEIKEKLELEKGVLMKREAITLDINDKFLEYQIDRLRNEKRDVIQVKGATRIPSDDVGLALKLPLDIADSLDFEESTVVIVKVDDEKSFRGYLSVNSEFCILKFKENLDLNAFRNGFEIEPSVSTGQFDVQRSIINDFRTGKINIEHFEKVLINKNNIFTPTLKNIDFINEDLRRTHIENKDNPQVKAVQKAVGNQNIFLIQGPPGTGKTTVITEIIEQLVNNGEKILVSGQNHVAVDNVLAKLSGNSKLNLLRVGNAEKMDEKLIQFNIDNMILSYREDYKLFLFNQLNLINKLIELIEKANGESPSRASYNLFSDDLSSNYKKLKSNFRDKHLNLFDAFKDIDLNEIYDIKQDFEDWLNSDNEIIDLLVKPIVYRDANVVFATCIGIKGDNYFKESGFKFDTVIIDEAGKANITETLVPMELGKKVILVGDQKQLPPYLDSELLDKEDRNSFPNTKYGKNFTSEEIKRATESSFFEFLINRIKEKEFPEENLEMLSFQHRMHPTIGEFVSQSFYDGNLKMGNSTIKNRLLLKTPFDKEIVFFDTSNVPNSYEQKKDNAVWNEIEVKVLVEFILPELKSQNVTAESIAIIAPYKSQVSLIKRKIKESADPFFIRIDVATLDSFQGKEYDMIIFSFTRSADHNKPQIFNGKNKYTKVGFLDDARRLNVAFSRAKKKLILIGNADTLRDKRSHYDFLFDYTALFETLVNIAKDESKGRFVNIADNYSVKSDFEKFISKYKKNDIVKALFKFKLKNENGTFLIIFTVDSYDCALHSSKIDKLMIDEIDNLKSHDLIDLKVENINRNTKKVTLSSIDFVSTAFKNTRPLNDIRGLSIGENFKAEVRKITNHGYIINLKENLNGFLNKSDIKGKVIFNVNDIVHVKIKSIDKINNKIYLRA